MGLRINTNVGALSALRNLRANQADRAKTLEGLSTGLSINRASDNPSGLVLSELIRSQLGGLQQAIENNQGAQNILNTADAGLGEISDQLVEARSLAVQAGNGTLSSEQQQVLQYTLDQTLRSIDRIADTTRFADQSLLNGEAGYNVTPLDTELRDVNVVSAELENGQATIDVNVQSAATRAQATGAIAATQSGPSTIEISGSEGTAQIDTASGATQAEVSQAINDVTDVTGVEVVGGVIQSTNVGSSEFVDVQFVQGSLDGVTEDRTTGTDISGLIGGAEATGSGNQLSVNTGELNASVLVQEAATGTFQFEIDGGGLRFQINEGFSSGDRVNFGIPNVGTGSLGDLEVGTLSSLANGQPNSLLEGPGNAIRVLDGAISQVNSIRSGIGSLESRLLESTGRALDVRSENLSASLSDLRDTDFAAGALNLSRNLAIDQGGLLSLQNANLSAGLILRLLG